MPYINQQDLLLQSYCTKEVLVTAYLINGVQIRGVIKRFDKFIVEMDSNGHQNLIYKHAISTLIPTGGNAVKA